jgi:pimeloyl-ACP methyl ester carboxylesterase
MKKLLALAIFAVTVAHAEVVSVPARDSEPTKTFIARSNNARGTMIVILGGEGRIGLADDAQDVNRASYNMLKPLVAAGYNLVAFDSPYELVSRTDMSAPRRGSDHQRRINDVVRYYAKETGKPVWLFGHSAGAVSVSEYANNIDNRVHLAGIVISGEHAGTWLDKSITMPVLFLHHESDGCRMTSPGNAKRQYERLTANTNTQLIFVQGGTDSGDPCRDGYHMYRGSYEQAEKIIEDFVKKY